ncbi:MAG TPA: phosphate ABC transporter ATP-binding protein [Anaerolineae bacterium]|nr:phosphate ABC transporter ATP-binding protein [Anaerolineae bacterium]
MSDYIYRLQNVAKMYDDRPVLRIDHLQIKRGEVLALVGPSGAGKSTLLRLLNFLEPPTTGRIRFLDVEFGTQQSMPLAYRRRVTTVFQRPLLLNRSVRANVRYGLGLRGRRDVDERIGQALEQVGLAHLARQRARTLSGGEAQRVALARAIVLEPDVLLLDEPTANLDPYNIGIIEEIVAGLNRSKGTTTVLVTHNVFQAKRLADRVALILEGQIVELTDVDTFFDAPEDSRTRAFVKGEMVY